MRIFNGLIAVARDVLPPDHPHHRDLEEHRSANGMQPSRELSSNAEIRLAKLLTTGAVQVLLKLPDQIEATAFEPNCSRKDRVARLAHAFLLGLKLDHPGLTEKQSARMNLTCDIVINQGKKYLHLSPLVRGGQCTVEPMTEESSQRLERLFSVKRQTGLSSPLLFPSREENFGDGSSCRKLRGTANVMQCLYADIQAATGLKLTFTDIKDLVVRVLLESGIEPFVVARRAGYKHLRSVEQRMAAFFRAVGPS